MRGELARNCLGYWMRNSGSPYGLTARLLGTVRPLRVLAYPRMHEQLLELPVYREFGGSAFGDDIFHHLSHRHYLRKGLTLRRRIEIAYGHYKFESERWDESYRQAVYSHEGLGLWRTCIAGDVFTIRLNAAKRAVPEGDLCVTLALNELRVHRINFSWLVDDRSESMAVFLARAQTSRYEGAFDLFRSHFPQQHPQFFSFAAIQGIAQVVGFTAARGVRSGEQICASATDERHFERVYDDFWTTLGGWDDGGEGFLIPLPAHRKSLDRLSASHRRRAQRRRKQWDDIAAATAVALEPHLISPPATASNSIVQAPRTGTAFRTGV